jgi:glutamine cyclotransferase
VYHEGRLYESTGLHGRSSLQKIDAQTGEILAVLPVPEVFAEGLAYWNNRLIQLTWKSRLAFIYAMADFAPLGVFHYESEGWGLTADDHSLIMSDGTETLTFRNPQTFQVERTLRVTLEGEPLRSLNELEYIHGLIYANVWYESFIVQIDPDTGIVVGVIDASPLLKRLPALKSGSVLNGIAYDEQARRLYLTGKNWPDIFEVNLIRQF